MILKPEYTIEKANWRDLNQLRNLERECFGEEAWPLISLIGVLTFPNVIRLKAVSNEEMAGFISADIDGSAKVGWITSVGVLERYRGKGIGKALMLACERLISSPAIQLTVKEGNDPAIKLYLDLGYKKVETWPNYYASGENGILMRKEQDLA